jgi:hypothetical protein
MYWRAPASEVGMLPLGAFQPSAKTLFVARLKGSMDGEFPLWATSLERNKRRALPALDVDFHF